MNNKVLLVSMWMLSTSASATQVFMKGSNCLLTEKTQQIELVAQSSGSIYAVAGREASSEQVRKVAGKLSDDVKMKLFEALSTKAQAYSYGVIVDRVVLKERIKDTSKEVSVSGRIVAYPVTACETSEAITAKNYNMITATSFSGKTQRIAFNVEIDPNPNVHVPKQTQVDDMVISQKQIFGIRLGYTYTEAEKKVGRFTLVWPLNERQKLAIIGRNHALLFENNLFVGYQYAFNLLPVSLANLINIYDINLAIHIQDETVEITKVTLSEKVMMAIKNTFPSVTFYQEGKYTKEPKTKLSGLQIGEFNVTKPAALSCYKGQIEIDEFVQHHQQSLVQWQSVDAKTVFYTGCNQLIELNKLGKVTSLKLLEPWSLSNANLIGLADMTSVLSPWEFYGVHYLDPENKASLVGEIEDFYGTIEVTAELWAGHFKSYDGQLVSAEFEKM